jgi:hypothetical protein
MTSTHIFPQRYKLHRIRYDTAPIAEGTFGQVYRGRDLNVYVNIVTDSRKISVRSAPCIPQT